MMVDIAIPSYQGGRTIGTCLDAIQSAITASEAITVGQFMFDIRPCGDSTEQTVREFCAEHGHAYDLTTTDHNLPDARENLIHRCEAPWMLFVDDDVYLDEMALARLSESVSPNIGGIQTRRASDSHEPYEWSRWRPIRGTCFATLLRHDAVADIDIPSDCTVLEDEYIRRYVESNGYIWLFDHGAEFTHDCQDRHEIDFNEGRIAGRYGLLPAWYVFGNVGFNLSRPTHLPKHARRVAGYVYGRATA